MKSDNELNNKPMSNHHAQCTVSFATGSAVTVGEVDQVDNNPTENDEDNQAEVNRGLNEFTFSPSYPLNKMVQKAAKQAANSNDDKTGPKGESPSNKRHSGKM
ncbi:unnamed protein product [Trichobilharzia regenti]|nr:unnamed protein product [Trichobilharzia regenti]